MEAQENECPNLTLVEPLARGRDTAVQPAPFLLHKLEIRLYIAYVFGSYFVGKEGKLVFLKMAHKSAPRLHLPRSLNINAGYFLHPPREGHTSVQSTE